MVAGPRAREARAKRRDEVRAGVCRSAIELVGETPFTELTVDEIARAAGISRSAFYFYFLDKQDLLMAAADEVAAEPYREAERRWHGDGPPEVLIRQAIEGVVGAYGRHAKVLQIATEVSSYDESARSFWRALVGRFIESTADYLRRQTEAGRVAPIDPQRCAESLVWMTERCCYVYLGRGEREPAEVVTSLSEIWLALLYPESRAELRRAS
jgi:TetR/AcrR family transcriptional regulator, ethionamide resistance regulator